MLDSQERQEIIDFILGWTRRQLEAKTTFELRGLMAGLGLHEQMKRKVGVVDVSSHPSPNEFKPLLGELTCGGCGRKFNEGEDLRHHLAEGCSVSIEAGPPTPAPPDDRVDPDD